MKDTLLNLKLLKNRKPFRIYVKQYIIYKITNIQDGRLYIGITNRIMRRIVEHIRWSEQEGPLTSYIHKAIRKYGLEQFTFEVIGTAENDLELEEKEIDFISTFNSNNPEYGYNLTSGGGRGTANEQNTANRIAGSRKQTVAKYDLKGNYIEAYPSVQEASRQNHIPDTDIHRCDRKKWSRNGFMYRKFTNRPLLKIEPYVSRAGINLKTQGAQGHNRIKCQLRSKITGEIRAEANSLLELADKVNMHATTIQKIFHNQKHKKWEIIKIIQ